MCWTVGAETLNKQARDSMYQNCDSVRYVDGVLLLFVGFQSGHRMSEREYVAEHLEPGHAYRVRVCCYSAGGQSEVGYVAASLMRVVL